MQFLRANTQVVVTIGPFVDVTDGFTPQTDIALSGNEAELIKHGSTSVVDISGATWAAVTDCRGYYSLTLTTSHTDTEGLLVVVVQDDSDCLPVKAEFMVLSEAAWDSMFVAKDDGFMDVNVKTLGRADTQETEVNNAEAFFAATGGTAAGNFEIVFNTDFATNYNTTRDAWATNVQDFVGTTASDPFNGTIVDAVWDEALTGSAHNNATSAGRRLRQLGDAVAGTVVDVTPSATEFTTSLTQATSEFYDDQLIVFTSGNLSGQLRPIASYDGSTKTITVTEAFTSAPANGDAFDILPVHVHPISAIADGVWDELQSGHAIAGSFGAYLNASISTLHTYAGATYTAWLDGGRLDVILDEIRAFTGTTGVVVAAASKTGYSLTATTGLGNQTANITGNLSGSVGSVTSIPDGAIGADAVADIFSTTAIAEAYAADGAAGTVAQILYLIQQALSEFSISGTTITMKKLDGSTTAATFTMDDATTPTSRTRAT